MVVPGTTICPGGKLRRLSGHKFEAEVKENIENNSEQTNFYSKVFLFGSLALAAYLPSNSRSELDVLNNMGHR